MFSQNVRNIEVWVILAIYFLATMKVYQDFFTYSGGIYKHSDMDLYRDHGYHSVRITGWGEEYTSNGYQKYWVRKL